MVAITIRNIPDETYRTLKILAQKNGRSIEAEIEAILEEAVGSKNRIGLGSSLENLGRKYGGVDLDGNRDRASIEPASFE